MCVFLPLFNLKALSGIDIDKVHAVLLSFIITRARPVARAKVVRMRKTGAALRAI